MYNLKVFYWNIPPLNKRRIIIKSNNRLFALILWITFYSGIKLFDVVLFERRIKQ